MPTVAAPSVSLSVEPAIRRRFSCRSYSDEPIDASSRSMITGCLATYATGPLGTRLRFALITAEPENRAALKGLTTYGFIRNPGGFIIGACGPGPRNLEDYGYALEHGILAATEAGLGTCWLGGTFSRSNFTRRLDPIADEEEIPAVVSVGSMVDRDKAQNTLMRRVVGSRGRLFSDRLFFDRAFGRTLPSQDAGRYATPLEMVRLAPSASNKQPWRIVKVDRAWHFFLQRSKGYRGGLALKMLKVADIQRVDMGIAMCHFELAAREVGLQGTWIINEPDIEKPDATTEYSVTWMEG